MGNGVVGKGRAGRARPAVRWWVLVVVVVGAGLTAWYTTSLGTAMELVAVLGLLLGVGIAFGAAERRPRRSASLLPPARLVPDERLAARAEAALASLDRIEHRRLELGAPWPQVFVGPTGAAVVDLCPVDTVVELDRSGVRDRGAGAGRPCTSCQEARRVAASVRDVLDARDIELPVRTVSVVADDTRVVVAPDAPDDLAVVTVARLGDTLARGPVLPMRTVDAAFDQLARTVASEPHRTGA